MKVGMCGVRAHGLDFMKLLCLHPDVESVSIADTDAAVRSAAAEVPGVARAFASLDELLATDVDAVGIFTPPWLHAEQSVRALEAGKHVMAACPLGLTLEEVRAVVDAVERTGRIYMTAETTYYRRVPMYARRAWAEERFGDFVYGEGEYYYRPHAYDFWMRDYYGNMPPMLYPTHSTAHVVGVIGRRVERLTCVGVPGLHPDAASKKRRPEWRDNETSNMTLLGQVAGGGVCRINEMRNVGCWGEMGSIIGTLGSIREHVGGVVWTNGFWGSGDTVNLSAQWQDPAQDPQAELAARLPASFEGKGMGHGGSHRFLVDEFVRAVRDDRRPHNHVWMAAMYCVPGIVAWESIKRGSEWLDVPDFCEPNDGRRGLDY